MKKDLTINEKCSEKIIKSKKKRMEKVEEVIDCIVKCFDKEDVVYVKLNFVRKFKEEKKIEPLNNISGFSFDNEFIYSVSPSFNPDILPEFKLEDWQELIKFFYLENVEVIRCLYSDSCYASEYSLKFFPKCLLTEKVYLDEYNLYTEKNLAQRLVDTFKNS